MNVFVTGATGYIGSVVAEKLQQAGHKIAGLARSDASAAMLAAQGIKVVRGDLGSLPLLADAAHAANAVVHAAFNLDGGDFAASVATDVSVVRTFLDALRGTDKPLVVTSGTAILGDTGDRVFTEETPVPAFPHGEEGGEADQGMKALSRRVEIERDMLSATGVHGIVLRPPNVYGRSGGRSVLTLLKFAGQFLGAVPYAQGTGEHQWSFVHVDDLADLYVLALENAKAGELFQASGESGLHTKAIAEALSRGLGLGGKTVELDIPALGKALGFPPLADYWAINSQSSAEKARRVLGWKPQHVQMLTDLAQRAA